MATIVNARDVLLQAASTRLNTVTLPSNLPVDFDNVNGSHKPSNNADVTQAALIAGVTLTNGGITLSAGGALKGGKTVYGSGTGIFFGYSGSAYKLDIGSSSNYLRWDGSSLQLRGDIIGTSSIDITGGANFGGSIVSGGLAFAVVANESLGASNGLKAYATSGSALAGEATSGHGGYGEATTGIGLEGHATTGIGTLGSNNSSSAAAVLASNAGTGPSLECQTKFKWGSITIDAPVNAAWKFLDNQGNWTQLGKGLKYISGPAATSGASLGFITVDTFDTAVGQCKIQVYAL